MTQASLPALCPQRGSKDTYKLLSRVAVVSGNQSAGSAPMQGGGCACGGSCACGAH